MKKIMFNDRYGLTQAVLEGKKTMTRRIIPLCENDLNFLKIAERDEWLFSSRTCLDGAYPAYNVGDELAVAQAYKYIRARIDVSERDVHPCAPGWNNKMFVRADLMPHRIRITNIRVERLQDITDEDCLKEGIYEDAEEHGGLYTTPFYDFVGNNDDGFHEPRAAFAALIDKVSGKGTWKRNQWVFVYEFELVK